jgi:hypothetical protein
MPPKHTNAQYRSRLAYNAGSQPAFLRALQAQISGKPLPPDNDESSGDWERPDASRPAILRRPDAPDGDAAEHDSGDDEEGDERPQVVVLKEGKHLSELEVTSEKRRRMFDLLHIQFSPTKPHTTHLWIYMTTYLQHVCSFF